MRLKEYDKIIQKTNLKYKMDLFPSDERSKFEDFFIPKVEYHPSPIYMSFSVPKEQFSVNKLNTKDKISFLEERLEEKRKQFEDFEVEMKRLIEELTVIESQREKLEQKIKFFNNLSANLSPNEVKKEVESKVTEWQKEHDIEEFAEKVNEFKEKYKQIIPVFSFSLNKGTGTWVPVSSSASIKYPVFPSKELRDKFLKDFPSDILFLLYPEDSIYQKFEE